MLVYWRVEQYRAYKKRISRQISNQKTVDPCSDYTQPTVPISDSPQIPKCCWPKMSFHENFP